MSEYLLLNILVVAIPFIMSFEKQVKFYKNILPVITSILVVGTAFLVWDAIATYRGDWSFNKEFINGFNLFNLPIEEILFFVTVPYSSIFLYETFKIYLKEKEIDINRKIIWIITIVLLTIGILFFNKYYTATVLLFSAIFLIIALNSSFLILRSSLYWKWITFTYIPFFLVNYILTSLPVVIYSPNSIWGGRVLTIPIEDFFYSFSLLSFNLLVYLWAKKKWQRK